MQIKNKTAGIIFLGEDATLHPGNNDVEDAVWERWRKHEIVGHHLKAKRLVMVKRSLKDLSSLKTDEAAVAVVKETFDPELLKSWLASEKRGAVQKAVSEQLDSIKSRKRSESEQAEEDSEDGAEDEE